MLGREPLAERGERGDFPGSRGLHGAGGGQWPQAVPAPSEGTEGGWCLLSTSLRSGLTADHIK